MSNKFEKTIGEKVNSRWEITKPLTSDTGQAHTYKVKDSHSQNDNSEYVIKLLKKINDKTLARFKKEIEASLLLDHPNIVQVIDSDYKNTSEPYLVTEFCSGGELETRKIKSLSLIERLKMFESICAAIAHAHAQDKVVIHRDIKPSNIFLRDPKTRIPVVGDFGICFFEEAEDDRLTEIKEQVGAKNFRPPEAEFGIVENVNPSFDIYSLGKLLYWFLSDGNIPVREHYKHPKFDLRNNYSEFAIHLAYEIFDKSICEEPEKRYENATEMFEDVGKLIEFVESDARYLDCSIPQHCIFCKNGNYEFESSPSITRLSTSQSKISYYKSKFYGYSLSPENIDSRVSKSFPIVLIGHCNHCGNIQQFRLDDQFGTAKNWKNVPDGV